MNRAAQELGRLGGRVRSEAKTNANRINAQRYWDAVRAGTAKGPRRGKGNRPVDVQKESMRGVRDGV